MGKSILVKDTPESCNRCDSCIIGSVVFCGINGKKIDQQIMNESKRSEKCPLQEVPSKKEDSLLYNAYMKGKVDGYNACIDEIIK